MRLTFPKFHAIDGNGNPIRGGKLYTYAAGTSTNKTTYTDYAMTTPHTNPIILDSNGEALVFLSGAYNMNLLTAADAQVPGWPIDNIRGAGCCSTVESFDDGDLDPVDNTLTIPHGYGQANCYVQVFDENGYIVIPEYTDCISTTQIVIGFGNMTLSGTWSVRYGI